MADRMSVMAWLSAHDNMSGVFKHAAGASQRLGASLKQMTIQGAGMQLGMSAVNKALGMMSASLDGAISRYDTLNNFPKVMNNLGISASDAETALNALSTGIDGLPTTLDAAASGVKRFTSANGDINKSTDYFIAMNDAILAGGASVQEQESAVEQLSQSYAKGRMDMMEWRAIQSAMPGQLNQVAKAMGMTTTELGEGLRTGSVAMDDFMDTIVKLDKGGVKGIKSFHDQAQDAVGGIATNISIFKTTVVKGVTSMIESIDAALGSQDSLPFHSIGEGVKYAAGAVKSGFATISTAIGKVDLAGIVKGAMPYYKALKGIIGVVGAAIKKLSGFLNAHAETIARVGPAVWMLVSAFSALKFLSGIGAAISLFSGGLLAMAKSKALALLPAKLTATATAEAEAGTAGAAAAPNMLKLGGAVLMIGAGVLMAAGGIALLAQSAIALAGAGGPAVAVMFGLMAAMTGMMAVVALLGPALVAGAAGALMFGAAVLMLGAGVLAAAAGLNLMAKAMPILASTTSGAAKGLGKLAAASVGLSAASAAMGVAAAALGALAAAGKLAGMGLNAAAKSSVKLAAGASAARASVSGFASSLKTMSTAAGKESTKAISSMTSKMKSGVPKMKGLGAQIGRGFAAGMRSALGSITSVANEYVRQVDKIVRAKAKIHSPSRLMKQLGAYMGEGFALGMQEQTSNVEKMASGLVNIPSMIQPNVPKLSMADGYSGSLSGDYYYGGSYQVEVPLYVNGKEFARATASDIDNELSMKQNRNNRKRGIL